MKNLLLDWAEAWATLIPIIVYLIRNIKKSNLKIILLYLYVALFLFLVIDIPWKIGKTCPLLNVIYPYNNCFYNISSIFRLFIFIFFFNRLNIPSKKEVQKIIVVSLIILIGCNFIFLDSFLNFSSKTFTLESFVLLSYCINYFIKKLKSENINGNFDSVLIIVTGLAIYESVCFFIFLFYNYLTDKYKNFAVSIWDIHNIVYIIFCLFLARAFYGPLKSKQHER